MAANTPDTTVQRQNRDIVLDNAQRNCSTTLEDLPNELLVIVAEKLKRRDLVQLALVSTRLSKIAQASLYAKVSMDYTIVSRKGEKESLLFLLWRTLMRCPQLAATIRSFSAKPHSLHRGGVTYALAELPEVHSSLPAYEDFEVALRGVQIFGMLLKTLLGLRELYFGVNGYEGSSSAYLIPLLFGTRSQGPRKDLSTVPGLRKLEVLSISRGDMEYDWCLLPKLRRMEIRADTNPSIPADDLRRSNVRSLHWEMNTEKLSTGPPNVLVIGPKHGLVGGFLSRLPNLVRLEVFLKNNWHSHMSHKFDWQSLPKMASSLCSHLEELELFQDTWPGSGETLAVPFSSLAEFTSLRTLELPQNILLGDEDEHSMGNDVSRSPVQILPPSIEELTIWLPSRRILPWLAELAKSPSTFPQMSKVLLRCPDHDEERFGWQFDRSDTYGQSYQNFLSGLNQSNMFEIFKDRGIGLSVCPMPTGWQYGIHKYSYRDYE